MCAQGVLAERLRMPPLKDTTAPREGLGRSEQQGGNASSVGALARSPLSEPTPADDVPSIHRKTWPKGSSIEWPQHIFFLFVPAQGNIPRIIRGYVAHQGAATVRPRAKEELAPTPHDNPPATSAFCLYCTHAAWHQQENH